jgi:AIPR protein
MASNDRIILDEVLKQRQAEVDPSASPSHFFELFSAEQVLKDFDLSYDEIESGLVGDGGDGGIDGIYLFVNGELVQEDTDCAHLKKNITLDLYIIQSKTSAGFQETPIERFITVSDDIFDLSKPIVPLSTVLNPALIEVIERFREVYRQLAAKFPTLRVSFFYTCKGADPQEGVTRKVEKLKAVVHRFFPSAEFSFSFLGASDLLALARRAPQTSYSLLLAESPVSSGGQVGFVCLVNLRAFYQFITDDKGSLRRNIFEANVRDYQGRTEVNDEIQQALKEKYPEDFWWLNNGVTILGTKASLSAKTLTIEDPQIVNGLQTSTEIFNYCSKFNVADDDRKVLVRVIVPSEAASRDRIIKATNSQTAVQQASLRATDKIHRDIEEFLRPKGFFYDRRKNFYKNEGKPRDKIVGIPHLAQAVMAIVLRRPDTARARPSSLLKKNEDYEKVYSPNYPIHLYYVCAEAMRRVELLLRSPGCTLPATDRNNLRYYLAMHAVVTLAGTTPAPGVIANVDISKLTDARIEASLGIVQKQYEALGASDQAAKGSALLEALLKGP